MRLGSYGALAFVILSSSQSPDAFVPAGGMEHGDARVTRNFLFRRRKNAGDDNAENYGTGPQIDPWDQEDAYTQDYVKAQRHKMPSLLPDPPKCDTPERRSARAPMNNVGSALWPDKPRLDQAKNGLHMTGRDGLPRALAPDVDDYYSATYGNSASPDYEQPTSFSPDDVLSLGRNQRNHGIPNALAPDTKDYYAAKYGNPASPDFKQPRSLTPDDVLHLGGYDPNKAAERHHKVPGGLSPDPPSWDAPRNNYSPAPLHNPRSSSPDRPIWEGQRRPLKPLDHDRLSPTREGYMQRPSTREDYDRRSSTRDDDERHSSMRKDSEQRPSTREDYERRPSEREDNEPRLPTSRGYERPRMQPQMQTRIQSWTREDDIDEDDVDAALDFFMRKMSESAEFQHLTYEERIALAASAVVENQKPRGLMSKLLDVGKWFFGRQKHERGRDRYYY